MYNLLCEEVEILLRISRCVLPFGDDDLVKNLRSLIAKPLVTRNEFKRVLPVLCAVAGRTNRLRAKLIQSSIVDAESREWNEAITTMQGIVCDQLDEYNMFEGMRYRAPKTEPEVPETPEPATPEADELGKFIDEFWESPDAIERLFKTLTPGHIGGPVLRKFFSDTNDVRVRQFFQEQRSELEHIKRRFIVCLCPTYAAWMEDQLQVIVTVQFPSGGKMVHTLRIDSHSWLSPGDKIVHVEVCRKGDKKIGRDFDVKVGDNRIIMISVASGTVGTPVYITCSLHE